MAEHLIFHDCADEVIRVISDYWTRKTPRLERLLQHFPDDQRHTRLYVRRHPKRYEAHVALRLPTGTLVAEADAKDYLEALDVVSDRLAAEIRRHKEVIRRAGAYRRRRPRSAVVADASVPLAAHRRARARAAFLAQLRPVLMTLRDHAHRELVLAQLQHEIKPGDLTTSDLLDETAALAWERFDDRPPGRPLDQWLVELLHEVLDARAREPVAAVSLEDRLPPGGSRIEADNAWVVENEPFWDEPAWLTLDEVLPSDKAPAPWQELAAEEQRRWSLRRLSELPRRPRRAFSLCAMEGWDEQEEAMLQQRSVEEVRADMEAVRQFLREQIEKFDRGESGQKGSPPPGQKSPSAGR